MGRGEQSQRSLTSDEVPHLSLKDLIHEKLGQVVRVTGQNVTIARVSSTQDYEGKLEMVEVRPHRTRVILTVTNGAMPRQMLILVKE